MYAYIYAYVHVHVHIHIQANSTLHLQDIAAFAVEIRNLTVALISGVVTQQRLPAHALRQRISRSPLPLEPALAHER